MSTEIKLNTEQLKAVRHKDGPLLIIAGAGTGKTTVICEKINYLLAQKDCSENEVLAKKNGRDLPLAISGGFVEFAENNLTILADTAERVEEIDEARAEEAKTRAQKILEEKQSASEIDYVSIASKLEKELARLKVSRKYKNSGTFTSPQIKIIKDEED